MSKNVIDFYKYWKTDAIKADLDTKRHNFSILCCNIQGDFNIGSVIRNANAFLAKEVIIYGRKKFDRRGAVGTQNYTNFRHVREAEDLNEALRDCGRLIAVDNVPSAKEIGQFEWPDEHFTVIFGEESCGIPKELLDISTDVVYIKQYGSVRSLNVACASAIVMYDILWNY